LSQIPAGSNADVDYAWEEDYLVSQTYGGLRFDGTRLSRPMVNNVNNGPHNEVTDVTQISNQFDTIAYNKASFARKTFHIKIQNSRFF
jgi:aminopeptidase N